MSRLFTFGCSYTHYRWPSWADILGKEFDSHENWGHIGLGNRAIAERVAECHVKSKITADDTVVIQWAGYSRHDWMHSRKRPGDVSYWRTKGNIFSPANETVFNQPWLLRFWDAKAYYLHTLNNIVMTQGLLKSIGCNWAMTSLTDLRLVDINDVEDLSVYVQSIWNDHQSHWLIPFNEFRSQHPETWEFKPSAREPAHHSLDNGVFTEGHMPVDQHAIFTQEVKKILNMPSSLTTDQQTLVAEINDIKSKHSNYDDFIDAVNKTSWAQTMSHQGY
jgi:hypothetical protein